MTTRREKSRELFEKKKLQRRQSNVSRPMNPTYASLPPSTKHIVTCIPEVPKYNILIKIASRSRPKALMQCVESFLVNASSKHDIRILITADNDDPSMKDWIYNDPRVEVCYGNSKSKISAINADINDKSFDILIAAADDQRANMSGYDELIAQEMYYNFPNLDGAINFHDGHVHRKLMTIPVIGYNLYKKFNYVYHPDYLSLWCDNEMTDLYNQLNRVKYSEQVPIEHIHFSTGKTPVDGLYRKNDKDHVVDNAKFDARRKLRAGNSKFEFEYPEILLSICICSLHVRAEMRKGLFASLNKQIMARPDYKQIEICVDSDNGETTIGAKRNRLLDRALGKFVCFVDDDDQLATDYVNRIMDTIIANPDIDCVGMKGIIVTNGSNPKPFIHSVKYKKWSEDKEAYYRCPNHLNPIRTEIARKVRFNEVNHGEDADFSTRVKPLLKKEVFIDSAIYYYLYRT